MTTLKQKSAPIDIEIGKRLNEVLSYDPETGIFTWKVTIHSRALRGSQAGTVNKSGYRVIQVDRHLFRSNRLAWFFMTGEWPTAVIDHINGKKDDDRFMNLRDVDQSTNMQNQTVPHKGNGSGFIGVSFHKATGKWCAQLVKKGVKKRHYGLFNTPEEASAVYQAIKAELHVTAHIKKLAA